MSNLNSPTGDTFTRSEPAPVSEKAVTDPKKPDMTLTRFSELTPEKVRSQGNIRGMVFDVDDTLSRFKLGERSIPPELLTQLKTLQDSGIKLGIVTNNPSDSTAEKFRQELNNAGIHMEIITHASKPHTKGLEMMQEKFGLPASQMMMVGDQRTDVETGKRAGFKTAQVDWFHDSTLHKQAMHGADKALAHADKFKAMFDPTPDQPEFLPPPKNQPVSVSA